MKRYLVVALSIFVLGLVGSVQAGSKQANTLTKQEKQAGWKLLFDGKSLEGWRCYRRDNTGNWQVKDGAIFLSKPGSGDLMTEKKFGDFEFSIDWKFETGNNSGIIYRVAEINGPSWRTGPEMQVMSHSPKDKLGATSGGSLYDTFGRSSNPFKRRDSWTTYKIVCRGKHIEHWVNGEKVVDTEIGSKEWNEHLAQSKWKNNKDFASQSSGHIALQDHGGKIYYRNIKIRVLDKE